MTKRQRVIAEEEAPLSSKEESEAIVMARKRIAELELFIAERRKAQ